MNRNEEETNAKDDDPTLMEEWVKLIFRGLKTDNSIVLLSCEWEMELIGNNLSDKEKIDVVSKHFQDSAARLLTNVRET